MRRDSHPHPRRPALRVSPLPCICCSLKKWLEWWHSTAMVPDLHQEPSDSLCGAQTAPQAAGLTPSFSLPMPQPHPRPKTLRAPKIRT